jgi:PAS domain S-box-containing protein
MTRPLRILLLEDDSNDATLILLELKRGGVTHEVQCVSNWEAFLAALAEFKPELVLSDHSLPGFTGIEAMTVARQQLPDLPFILVTGALGEEVAVETIKKGATDYILKHQLFHLVPAILRAVREGEQRAQRRQAEELLKSQHQQLAVQNEALRQVHGQLEAAHKRYAHLYDTAPVGYTSLSQQGIIHEINVTAAEMLGHDRQTLIGTPFGRFVLEQQKFASHLRQCIHTDQRVRTELTLITRDRRPVSVELLSVRKQEADQEHPFYQTTITDVTERKQAEQILRESEERFRQLAENIHEVFWLTDPAKREMIYISPGYEQIWGRTCQSLYSSPQDWIEAVHPDDLERVSQAVREKQHSGKYNEEYRIVRPDGSERWIQDRAFPIRNEAGEVYRIAGIAEDITSRKQVEQALRRAEANYRSIFENAIEGIFQTTPEGRYLSANPALAHTLGYASPEALLSSISDIGREMCVDPRTRVELKRRLEAEGAVRGFENQIYRKDGSKIWISVNARVVRDAQGRVLYYEGTSQDITRRKMAEAQIAILAHAVESTTEALCITDLQDRFVFVNRAFQQTYGYSEGEILGKTPSILFSNNNAPSLLAEILEQTRLGGWRGEVLDRKKDGTEFPIFLSTSKIKDRSGQVLGLMGVAQDITARKQAEKQIRLLADAMQSAHELICITDHENRFTFANHAFFKAYGYTEEEVLGRTPAMLYSTKQPPGLCDEIYRQTLEHGWTGELLNCRKDGSEFPISLSTSQIKDSQGRILGLVGVARDISERKRAEKQKAAFSFLGYRLSAVNSPEQAARIILGVASELFGWDAGYVHLYSPIEDKIVPILTVDLVNGERTPIPPTNFTLDPSPLMRSVMKEGARLTDREETAEQLVPFGDLSRPSASMMYVPIHSSAAVIGLLSIQSYTPQAYSKDDLMLLQALADYCGDALHRIKVADALQEAEAKYRSIFESATEGIFRTTPEGRYLGANPALAHMFGYRSSEELLSNVTDIERQTYVVPGRRSELKRLLETEGSVAGFEAERYRKDGTRFWMTINGHVIRGADGEVLYYEGTNQDITERKRAESVLRESEEKFRTLFESAPIGIALHDRAGKFVLTNAAYQSMLGYSGDELRKLGVKRITYPNDITKGQELFEELCSGKRDNYYREKRYVHKGGHLVWAQSFASAFRNQRGELLYIISMVEDITERRKVTEALRQSERKLRLIAENTSDVIFAFDMERRPVYINAAIKELTGYSFSDIQEKRFINWIHPDDQERMLLHWAELYQGKSYSEVEFRLVTKTGQVKWCSSSWGPLLDEHGTQIGVQGRERDITERKQLEREVLESTTNERRRIGHELHDGLGQYLAGIAFRAKALEQTLSNESLAHAREAKELATLISNAIGQTRSLARGLDPVEVETIGLPAALQNLAAETRKFFAVNCLFSCSDSEMRVDPQTSLALYRIVQEAIHNAITHGDATRITVELMINPAQLILHVLDNGNGFVLKPANPDGMGLRVMHYRARAIGALLNITSKLKEGTEIAISVPVRKEWMRPKEASLEQVVDSERVKQ